MPQNHTRPASTSPTCSLPPFEPGPQPERFSPIRYPVGLSGSQLPSLTRRGASPREITFGGPIGEGSVFHSGMSMLAALLAILLAGCSSQQNALRAQARTEYQTAKQLCSSQNFKTHLELDKCQDEGYRRTEYAYDKDKDLMDQLFAERELLGAKIDRNEITQEDADLQLAQFKTNLIEQARQRQQEQQANAIAARSLMQQLNPPPQPAPTYQVVPSYVAPTHMSCNSIQAAGTVFTNCN
jgi:hypothetical protein